MSRDEQRVLPTTCLLGHSALDRLAYRRLLAQEYQLELAVDTDFRPISVWTALRHQPDLVLVDADRFQRDVLDALQMVARLRPQARILVLSAGVEPSQVEAWARCPLHGYVVKDGALDELRAALDALCAGREYFSAGIREALARGERQSNGVARLTRREAELLPLLASGMTLRDAARQMTISYKTADAYRTTLLRKLGVHDRVELARYAIRARIIDP